MRRLALAALVWLCACTDAPAPAEQVVLYVDTDAPLPEPAGTLPTGDEAPPLFDSLQVEVFRPGELDPCEGCVRIFSLDRQMLLERRASFGIPVEADTQGYRVRLRLYDSAATLDALVPTATAYDSPPQSVVDRTVALPTVPAGTVVEATVLMLVSDVGLPVGSLEQPAPAVAGPVESSRVGSWAGARRVTCAEPPSPEQVCVPGGAFWQGNPRARGNGIGDANNDRRLVALSPYFMDRNEVTVADWRAFPARLDFQYQAWSGDRNGDSFFDFCTFTELPGENDTLPMQCVSYEGARAYCQAKGGDLPSEAQFEYVAGGLQGRLFVWGGEEPACADAVLQRYAFIITVGPGSPDACQPLFAPGSAEPVGTLVDPPRRDRLDLEGGTLFDLVGNAAEWAQDLWNRQSEPCWSHGGVYYDPVCTTPSELDPGGFVFRGGSWFVGPRQASAAYRGGPLFSIAGGQGADLGFRCARPATPAP